MHRNHHAMKSCLIPGALAALGLGMTFSPAVSAAGMPEAMLWPSASIVGLLVWTAWLHRLNYVHTQALMLAKREIEGILEAVPDLLIELDEACRCQRVLCSRRDGVFAATHGMSGRLIDECLPSEPAHVVTAAVASARREGHDFGRVLQWELPEGLRWFELSVASTPAVADDGQRYVVLCRDVTARKRVEAELAKMVLAVEQSPNGIAITNRKAEIEYVNPGFLRLTGYSREELIGQNPRILKSGRTEVAQYGEMWDALMAGESWIGELVDRRKDGTEVPVRTQITPVRRPGGEVTHYLATHQDMTREIALDRMKSDFLSLAAHELRTPIVSIHGFSELLLKRSFDVERQRDMFSTILRHSTRLIDMINDLMDLAQIEARAGQMFDIVPQPLEPVLAGLMETLPAECAGRDVELVLPDALPMLAVDKQKLQKALRHLISNACKYSAEGSSVHVAIKRAVRRERPCCGIAVIDRGIGISPEHQAQVFERFFRADHSGSVPGTGLGLSLAKEIVELMGGSIELYSVMGRGTEVVLWLPEYHEHLPFAEKSFWEDIARLSQPDANEVGFGAGDRVSGGADREAI